MKFHKRKQTKLLTVSERQMYCYWFYSDVHRGQHAHFIELNFLRPDVDLKAMKDDNFVAGMQASDFQGLEFFFLKWKFYEAITEIIEPTYHTAVAIRTLLSFFSGSSNGSPSNKLPRIPPAKQSNILPNQHDSGWILENTFCPTKWNKAVFIIYVWISEVLPHVPKKQF